MSQELCDDCRLPIGNSRWHLNGRVVCDGCKYIMCRKDHDDQIAALTAERDAARKERDETNLAIKNRDEATFQTIKLWNDEAEKAHHALGREIARLRALVEAAYREGVAAAQPHPDSDSCPISADEAWNNSDAKRAVGEG